MARESQKVSKKQVESPLRSPEQWPVLSGSGSLKTKSVVNKEKKKVVKEKSTPLRVMTCDAMIICVLYYSQKAVYT